MSLGLQECAYLGGDCKLYYNSATYDTPTWVEIKEVGDVNLTDFANTMAEVATRAGPFALNKPAKTRLALEAMYVYRSDDPVWQYLKGIFLAKTPIHLAVMDGDIAVDGTEGLWMVAYMEAFPIGQPLEEIATHDTLRFVPGYICDGTGARIDPEWKVIVVP